MGSAEEPEYDEHTQLLTCRDICRGIKCNTDPNKTMAYHQWLCENVVKLVCDNGCRRYCTLVKRLGDIQAGLESFEKAETLMEDNEEVTDEQRKECKEIQELHQKAFDLGSYEMFLHSGVLAGMFYNALSLIELSNEELESKMQKGLSWEDMKPCLDRLRFLIRANQRHFGKEEENRAMENQAATMIDEDKENKVE